MKRVSYKEMFEAIASYDEFIGNSVTAFIREDKEYNIMSYSTLIFKIDLNKSKIEYFDNRFYSTTTSRLQNILKEVFPKLEYLCKDRKLYTDL